jgi:hypothetical protein
VGATVYLDEYTTSGVFVQSIVMPNIRNTSGSGNRALVYSGTQNNEGAITLSNDGQWLTLIGYNQTAYRTDLTGANGTNAAPSATIERVVGRVSLSGAIDTTTALTDLASGQSIRSAYTTNGTDIWAGGSSGSTTTAGVHYTTLGSTTSTQLTAGNTNDRILNGFNGQLYMSRNTSTAATRGVHTVGTGFPTSGGPALPFTQLPGFGAATTPTPSNEVADDYWFKDANTLYIADQRNGATGSGAGDGANGGVQKWLFTDTDLAGGPDTWIFQYNVPLGTQAGPTVGGNVGGHGLAGTIDPTGNAVLFVTTFDGAGANTNRLMRLIDTGTQAGMAASLVTLSTSATNSAFRGVEFLPIPEPSALSLLGLGVVGLLRRRRD